MGLIILKAKGRTLLQLLIQDIGLIIVSFPLFGLVTGYFGDGFDDPDNIQLVNIAIFVLTIVTISINDWVKTRKPSANTV